jgi:transglutaminase-like putative cysteine protease
MRRKISGLLLSLTFIFLVISLPSVNADQQKTTQPRSAVVRYSLFMKSNYSGPHDIDFVWSFRDTNWSRVKLQSSKPILAGSATVDSQGQTVTKNSIDAIQAYGWRFEKVNPGDLFNVDFSVKVDISSFSPSSISSASVGKIEDLNKYFSGNDLKRYLNETYYWDYSNPEIQSVIQTVRGRIGVSTNIYDIVRGTLAWFAEHMMYDYPYEFDYPTSRVKASEVLKLSLLGRHFGVCRHFADLYTAIMRGFGIPCIKEEGLVLQDYDGKIRAAGRHAWCIAYLPKIGWTRLEVTVPDRSSLDAVGVGLLPYPTYYVPEYSEYANEAPRSSEGTVYPYVVVGGFIRVEEEEKIFDLTWDRIALFCALGLAAGLALAYIEMRSKIRKLERSTQPTSGAKTPYPSAMFCTSCGSRRPPFGVFCPNCGNKLK